MAVIESGVIFAGIPLVKVFYYNDKKADSILTAGLLEAIQSFANEIFGDETESFKMKKYCIYLHKMDVVEKNDNLLIYAICDSSDHPKSIRQCMSEIAKRFAQQYPNLDTSSLDTYKPFQETITKCYGDLRYRPEDRLRKVLF
ncbi:MAG: hypothetical protein GF308_01975 [Candidatus Heimdallarchaeota archaeon]|nr:hypothetical protein [Candidatus Heimdallarchaeota archaeon]